MTDEGGDTRPCPACGFEIRPEAIKCRHCGTPVVGREPETRPVCRLCRIAIALCVGVLLAGVAGFLLSASGP